MARVGDKSRRKQYEFIGNIIQHQIAGYVGYPFDPFVSGLVMGNTVILKPPKHDALLYAPLLATDFVL
jgi:hypothetical protein